VPLSDDEKEPESEDDKKPVKTAAKTTNAQSSSSWVHRNLQKSHVHASKATTYSPVERNPLYAGAEKTNNWDLSTLTLHYHPSAALFAKTIVDAEPVRIYN
jgi:ribosome biogenesis protein MAK21